MMLSSQFLTYRIEYIAISVFLSINSLWINSSVCAQIVPDSTLNTQINLVDQQQKITGGIEKGKNLFHSFQEFSPNANFDTHFDNHNNINNIFTRVTGDSASLINGIIKTNGNASLFILNPSGIIFGNNAQLEIGGSFIATTAESIIFADGTIFDIQINNTSPLLTVSTPIGLQYGNAPGAISSNNTEPITLDVSPEDEIHLGNTIAFLGGDVNLQNISIKASSGNVEIASLSDREILNLHSITNGWELNFDNVENFKDIQIHQDSQIIAGGKLGKINLRGKNIILSSGTNIENATNSNFEGGNTSLFATNYIDLNNIFLSNPVGAGVDEIGFPLEHTVTGKGGDLRIEAQEIKIRNGSLITSITLSQGAGGDIIINASESLELSGFNESFSSLILSGVSGAGEGGNVQINTGKLVIADGARVDSSTFASGKAGNIVVNAHESISVSGSKSFLSSNFNQEVKFNSGFSASSGFEGSSIPYLGESGSVTINTPQLSMKDGGEISVSNFGTEDAGNIKINFGELLLIDDSQIAAKTASKNGGSIKVNGKQIILRGEANITATADFNKDGRDGNGGNISITSDNLVMFDDSKINANASEGNGGNITITTQSLLTQDNPEDVITATASSDLGSDGVVKINTPDNNSKLETTQVRVAPLAGEESIYTGCDLGTDFSANRFSYIGRGGMRKGPFDLTDKPELIADLGLEDSEFQAAEFNADRNLNYNLKEQSRRSITEATTWIINDRGNVELIAQAANNPSSSGCLFN